MDSRFYLWALGTEGDVRDLDKRLSIQGATVSMVKVVSPENQSRLGVLWKWRTPYQRVSSQFPEDELEKFLVENMSLVNKLKETGSSLSSLGCMIVCDLEKGETLNGFSLSRRLISLLAGIDASLEIDINEVPPMGKRGRP